MSYQHILFATDLSHASLILGEKVKAISKALSAQLSICHVVEPPPIYPQQFSSTQKLLKKMQESANKTLRWYLETLQLPESCGQVVTGNVAQQITAIVKGQDIDCVLVGQQGAGGWHHVLGSTAYDLTQQCPKDVWILSLAEDELISGKKQFKDFVRIYAMDELAQDKDAQPHYEQTTETLAQKVAREKPHKAGVASTQGIKQATKRGPKPSMRPPSSPYGDPDRDEDEDGD